MDAPPAFCSLGRFDLRTTWRHSRTGAGTTGGAAGTSNCPLVDVEYTGPGTVSKERILAQMRTRVGQPYSNEVVEQDIAALYKTGSIKMFAFSLSRRAMD
jgi:outer membrane protein assembly factor BamA